MSQQANITFKNKNNSGKYYHQPRNLSYDLISNEINRSSYNQRINKSSNDVLFREIAIESKKAKKVLDVCQDDDGKGMLIIYQNWDMPNQRFTIIRQGEGVKIINCQNGKYLTVGSNSQKNGAPIFEEPTPGLKGQVFRLQKIKEDQYFIYTFCGKVLDCCQENTENGTRVVQYTNQQKQNQKWIIRSY